MLIKTVPEKPASLAMGFSWGEAGAGMKKIPKNKGKNKVFDIFFRNVAIFSP